MSLPLLHLADKLAPFSPDLLLLELLQPLLPPLLLPPLTRLLVLALLPLREGNLALHHVKLFLLPFLHFLLLLLLPLNLLRDPLLAGPNQRFFQPLSKDLLGLLAFLDFVQTFFLLDPELLFLFESLLQIFVFFPRVHGLRSALVLFVLLGLSEHELLVEIALGLKNEHLTEGVLVLLRPDPLLMRDLLLVGAGLLNQGLVLSVNNLAVICAVRKPHMLVLLEVGGLVQSVEQTLILIVFPFFVVHLVFVVRLGRTVFSAQELFLLFLQIALHFQVNDFGVVNADRALHRLLPDHLVNQVQSLLGQFNHLNCDVGLHRVQNVLHGVGVRVAHPARKLRELGLRGGWGLDGVEAGPCDGCRAARLARLVNLLLALESSVVLFIRNFVFCGLRSCWPGRSVVCMLVERSLNWYGLERSIPECQQRAPY